MGDCAGDYVQQHVVRVSRDGLRTVARVPYTQKDAIEVIRRSCCFRGRERNTKGRQ
jgi:hypothetical protein